MTYGADEIGMRGSICVSVIIVGAGPPGGVRLPWAKAVERWWLRVRSNTAAAKNNFFSIVFIIFASLFSILPFHSFNYGMLYLKAMTSESPLPFWPKQPLAT